ncbi:exosortase Y [Pedobacter rhodius]|uniref:Archaeosortase/exosortase family protein n=1 Tax=Pedobacter rhodius TaxID=3004098 RepID=A0ABT4KS79_9SPHI|nr:archaeosortase/exosortase family protein [Pedobacter sp. SJ11]MCZ4221786.1 archaeosortase/exosortase family protein [Pedobacter sp. SJ11]
MSEITTQQAKQQADKKVIKFIVMLFILYIVFSQGNIFMNSMMSPGGKYYNAYLADHFNYIQGLKNAIIIPAIWLIKLFGFYAIHNEQDVMVVNGPLLRISYSCLGLGVMSFLAAFVLAFPTSWKETIKMLVVGIAGIYFLNICRIAGLGILFGAFRSQHKYFEYHHEIFNVLVYIIIFVMLYIWIKKNTTAASKSKFSSYNGNH